ncbi:acyl-CoA reductase-like NAD-dependent aldehyde dehydrogenase [Novosphingobium sp. SG751A]|uniref:aldehyde dehydrogenase family protein n=1 Tax=Novosphingobium sp. SG751A TaxID=2587000 RepID=UPI0015530A6E|nr:aldehyde dehydrogenase family protein [Novosphingobium sp. SG751A]NOW45991.1 acyl-CoA reductase-like NAD-dependent aldehyde dehydrogenase [Novosphingobium sp. SG751A]
MEKTLRLLIDGQLVDGAGTMPVINPATGAAFMRAARADTAQLDAAVAAGRRAFPAWARHSYAERRAYLERFADGVEARFEEFARLLTMEQGKPLDQARFEVGGTVAGLRYFAAQDIAPHVIRDTPEERITEHRSPLGVVAAITPWNFPLILLVVKLGPALITGNVVIAKPAPSTPLTTLLLGEVAADILPAGVFQTLADANDLGGPLSAHAGVAHVSFTGSTATGKKVLSSTIDTLKRFTLELGGNDAALVLDDADVAKIAPMIFNAAMVNAGQVCLAAKRVYAPRVLYDDLCKALGDLARRAVVGDGMEQGSQIGPIQNAAQYAKLVDYLAQAREEGTVVAGGEPLERGGYFIAPTIVRDLPHDARLVQEEQFGPVLPLLPYDDLDAAIAAINASEYGLGGTIWTGDPDRGEQVAALINSGTVWINRHLDLPFDVPFGGAKQSGIGRQQGLEGLLEFTQAKIINMAKA